MQRADTSLRAEDPKAKVDQILAELIGRNYDLLSETGRNAAIEAIGSRAPGTDQKPTPEVPDGDTRSAWEAARGLCAEVQIKAALAHLDKLEPLPDNESDLMEGETPTEYSTARRQVGEQLGALRDEYAGDNNREVLENIHRTLFGGERPLFDQLREAGNFVPAHVNDRKDERQVIHYTAIRAFTAQLCRFGLSCDTPTTEPEGQSNVGQSLDGTERALRCARETERRLSDELAELGMAENCTLGTIPGVEFSGGGEPEKPTKAEDGKKDDVYSEPPTEPDAPCAREFFKLLRRVRSESGDWLENLDRDGKQGARLIRSEIDRIAAKAQSYRPKPPAKGKDEPLIARLVALFVGELERASTEIGRLLDG